MANHDGQQLEVVLDPNTPYSDDRRADTSMSRSIGTGRIKRGQRSCGESRLDSPSREKSIRSSLGGLDAVSAADLLEEGDENEEPLFVSCPSCHSRP
jgi:hypothetical protein